MTELEKLKAGEVYGYRDESFGTLFSDCERICFEYNNTIPASQDILKKLLGKVGDGTVINAPFRCDLGFNVTIGENAFINYGAVLLDCAPITIGNNVFIGPNVSLITPTHPLTAELRNKHIEIAKQITIEDNVWIAANVVVMPGVTIKSGSVIGAGSVVTKDIEANVLAFGNPCRIIKPISESEDFINYTL